MGCWSVMIKITFIGCFLDLNKLHPKVDVAMAPPTADFKNVRLDIPFKIHASDFASHYNSKS
jgi:hypothetical protein